MGYNDFSGEVFGDLIGDDGAGDYVMGDMGDDAGAYIMGGIVGGIVGDDAGFSLRPRIPAAVRNRVRQAQGMLRRYGPVAAQMDPRVAQAVALANRYGVTAGELIGFGADPAPVAVARPAGLPAGVQFKPHFDPRVVQYNGFSPTKARRVPLGFTSTAVVPAAGTAQVISRPQVPMRVERLVVPSDIAGLFAVTDLKVGNKSQFPASGAIPARGFQENAVGVELQGDTAYPAIDIVIEVLNISAATPATFRAMLVGETVQELSSSLFSKQIERLMYKITFCLESFKGPSPGAAATLRTMLDALTSVNVQWLRANPNAPSLYASGVVYQREPPGREDWQDIPCTLRRRNGDCEDLACWRAAELVVRSGIPAFAQFKWRKQPNGTLYHIVVQLPNGQIEDPSRVLGM